MRLATALLSLPLTATAPLAAQLTTLAPLPAPPATIPAITETARPHKPLTVTGARGAILGEQSGEIELWQLPVKLFSGLHLKAQLDGYTVPIDLNPGAATLTVRPGHTVLTYSFAGITVRQHMLVSPARTAATKTGVDDPGALLYFEIDSVRPATLTVTLTPNLQAMWPAPQYGIPGAGWVPMPDPATPAGLKDFPGGGYTLATDNPALFGMVAMPRSHPGDLPVYQEHPQTLPLQFVVRYDPAVDRGRLFPLLSTVARPGERNSATGFAALQRRLVQQARDLPALAASIDRYYAHFFDTRLTAHTPDLRFDEALRWAALSIDDAQVEHLTGSATERQSETGLVAGWFGSYDSARPGFGWYFGRDTLWSLYAIDSYGDTALSRRALEFLLHRQRADGKMMHEFSQTADSLPANIPWSSFPYEYAAADATPLFLLALRDYLRTSGDTPFLDAHYEAVTRAWHFERTHDSDGDGVYDNSEGTGWVENWQSPMPHQELYLAALDAEAARAVQDLATLHHDPALAQTAAVAEQRIQQVLATYRDPATGLYAFSKNADGTFDRTRTVYPAVALWEPDSVPAAALRSNDNSCIDEAGHHKKNCHPEQSGGPASAPATRNARSTSPLPTTSSFRPEDEQLHRSSVAEKPASSPATREARSPLPNPSPMLDLWTSPALATDWGTRAVSTATSFYDPISYHMGSVWPLFTGWNAMAQYNADRPAAAWLTLNQNLRLTWLEDPGTVTEVLSGDLYQPLGRSSAHQLWSSAMTLAPAVRGLFGVHADSTRNTLTVHPHLPPTWNTAELHHVRLGNNLLTLTYTRLPGKPALRLTATLEPSPNPNPNPSTASTPAPLAVFCLNPTQPTCDVAPARTHTVDLPLPAVEFALADDLTPQPGDRTHLPHITGETYRSSETAFTLHALPGTAVTLHLRRNGTLAPTPETVTLPVGPTDPDGYTSRRITLPATGPIRLD